MGRDPGLGQRGVIDPRDGARPEVGLEHLAHRRLRQFRQDLQVLRHRGAFVDMLLAPIHQLLDIDMSAVHQLHVNAGQFAGEGVGLTDRAGKGHGGVAGQRLLDLGGVDIVAAPDDQVLRAPRDPEVAVGVDPAQIAGAQVSPKW
jgi:hypothetical protein